LREGAAFAAPFTLPRLGYKATTQRGLSGMTTCDAPRSA